MDWLITISQIWSNYTCKAEFLTDKRFINNTDIVFLANFLTICQCQSAGWSTTLVQNEIFQQRSTIVPRRINRNSFHGPLTFPLGAFIFGLWSKLDTLEIKKESNNENIEKITKQQHRITWCLRLSSGGGAVGGVGGVGEGTGELSSSVRLALGLCGVILYWPPSLLKSRPKMSESSSVSLVLTARSARSSFGELRSEALFSRSSPSPLTSSWVGSGMLASSSDTCRWRECMYLGTTLNISSLFKWPFVYTPGTFMVLAPSTRLPPMKVL